jgi:cell division protein FtsW
MAKLGLVLWLAGLLERRRSQLRDWKATVAPAICVLVVVAGLIVSEPDLGTTTLVACITFVMLAVAGARLDSMLAFAAPLAVAGGVFSMRGYHKARLLAFLDPWKHADKAGWQTLQSQVGIASGGLFGVGIGNSKAKWGFLPEAHTDFIFAIIGEEMGLVGATIVIGLFFVFLVAGVNAGRRARDLSGLLVAVGISTWIGVQALVNIGVAVGALPNKGITLPFVSYGGTSLVVTMFAAGILLNVARQPGTVAPGRARRR